MSARNEYGFTKTAQEALYHLNHPVDCTRSPILLCSTSVHKFQGTGSRLFFLGRCLAEGLNAGRSVVLTRELESTLDMLSPFEPWSNCTEKDVAQNTLKRGVKSYYPMDSDDLKKTSEMPGAGALYPTLFKERGYWWWKAQEITYALRPTKSTVDELRKLQVQYDWDESNITVFQVRRTDKTKGCQGTYGIILLPLGFSKLIHIRKELEIKV